MLTSQGVTEHGNITHVPNEKRVSAEKFGNTCPAWKERENVSIMKSAENDVLNGMVISDQKVSLCEPKQRFLRCYVTLQVFTFSYKMDIF